MNIIKMKNMVNSLIAIINTKLIKKSFYSFGKSKIYYSVFIKGAKHIKIGNGVVLYQNSWLLAMNDFGLQEPIIEIGDNTYIGYSLHMTAVKKIIIEENVLIADKVYISDHIHNYLDIKLPIKDQGIVFKGEVRLNKNCWVGENVCIIGASIGKNSVVSANSVVTKNVPDYCIVAGIPAKIIKRFNFENQTWIKTNSNGEFIIDE